MSLLTLICLVLIRLFGFDSIDLAVEIIHSYSYTCNNIESVQEDFNKKLSHCKLYNLCPSMNTVTALSPHVPSDSRHQLTDQEQPTLNTLKSAWLLENTGTPGRVPG